MRLIRDDRGLTLPELLISMIILTLIISPLTGALIMYMRNSEGTVIRMSESQDLQLASAYFAGDVQSIGVRDSSLNLLQSVNNASHTCAGTGTPVLRLAWHEYTGATATLVRAIYVARDVPGERRLVRIFCRGAEPPAEIVLIHNLVGTPGLPVCVPATPANCVGAGASFPQTMTWSVQVKHPKNPSATTLNLTGQRRQS